MLSVGITGGIGAGKSTISQIFKVLGIPVYQADEHAKRLMNQDEGLKDSIKNEFGAQAYIHGEVNRDYLAGTVFNDPERLEKLNAIVHPVVQKDFEKWVSDHDHYQYLMKEAALLFETGSYKSLDRTIMISASESIRINRVLERDLFRTREEIEHIMARQMPENDKKKLAHYIIRNDENSLVLPQVLKIHKKLLEL